MRSLLIMTTAKMAPPLQEKWRRRFLGVMGSGSDFADGARAPHAHCSVNRRFRLVMKHLERFVNESGKIGYALLWLLGVPLPILLIIYLVRGH